MDEKSGEERLVNEPGGTDEVHPEGGSDEEGSGQESRGQTQGMSSPQITDANIATCTKNKEEKQDLPNEIDKLKCRARAFAGSFVVMVSPVLLAIVLNKVNLNGDISYQRIRMLRVVVNFVQRNFAHFAALTLQMGILPFLCVTISEACADVEITSRWLVLSKLLVFLCDILLMILGCGILLLINMRASLVVSACFIMATLVILVHIWSCFWYVRDDNAGGTVVDAKYHDKLEHSLDFSAGITVIMFLVLECVALDGLLRSTQGPCHLHQLLAPAPSGVPNPTGVTNHGRETTLLGATLFISFLTSAWGVLVMNVWTIPLGISNNVVFTSAFMMGLNIFLAGATVVVVLLITWEGLQMVAFLTLLPPFIPILVLLARNSLGNMGDDDIEQQQQHHQAVPHPDGEEHKEPSEEQKPAPLELTKVAFTGFLAVAVPSLTNTSLGIDTKTFVFFTAAAIFSGLLWRLLTHTTPSPAMLKAANQASFFAHACVFIAGAAFWVMAVNALK